MYALPKVANAIYRCSYPFILISFLGFLWHGNCCPEATTGLPSAQEAKSETRI
jgi:hypothetical protein